MWLLISLVPLRGIFVISNFLKGQYWNSGSFLSAREDLDFSLILFPVLGSVGIL